VAVFKLVNNPPTVIGRSGATVACGLEKIHFTNACRRWRKSTSFNSPTPNKIVSTNTKNTGCTFYISWMSKRLCETTSRLLMHQHVACFFGATHQTLQATLNDALHRQNLDAKVRQSFSNWLQVWMFRFTRRTLFFIMLYSHRQCGFSIFGFKIKLIKRHWNYKRFSGDELRS